MGLLKRVGEARGTIKMIPEQREGLSDKEGKRYLSNLFNLYAGIGYTLLGIGSLGGGEYFLREAERCAAEGDVAIPDEVFKVMSEFRELPSSMKESRRRVSDYAAGVVREALDLRLSGMELEPEKERAAYQRSLKGPEKE